jgi:elongation factor P
MATTADIRNGMMIRFNNDIFQIVEFLHVKPGKGAAFVRTKLKSVTTGKVLDNTFPSGAKLEEVRVEHRRYQYLYPDGDQYVFQDLENWEQVNVDKHLINAPEFLDDGMECEVIVNADEEKVLGVEVPSFVVLEVTYTEPGLKGDTATNTLKPATCGPNNVEIKVPLFVDTGEKIRIDTRTRSYMERVK